MDETLKICDPPLAMAIIDKSNAIKWIPDGER